MRSLLPLERPATGVALALLLLGGCNAIFGVEAGQALSGDGPGAGGASTTVGSGPGSTATSSTGSNSTSSSSTGSSSSGSSVGGGSNGGAGPGGGGTGAAGGGGSTSGGGGDAGGAPTVLVDDQLVSRYYFDEAASGTAPNFAADAAPNPENLTHFYDDVDYDSVGGNRGLDFSFDGSDGGPYDPTPTKHIAMLDGATATTLEVVLDLDDIDAGGSPLFLLDDGSPVQDFTVWFDGNTGDLWAYFDSTTPTATWDDGFFGPRAVLHLVFDSTQALEGDRVKLYRNGVQLSPETGPSVALNHTVTFAGASRLEIGGSGANDSIEGMLYYVAVYAKALSAAEVGQNAALLMVSDDAP